MGSPLATPPPLLTSLPLCSAALCSRTLPSASLPVKRHPALRAVPQFSFRQRTQGGVPFPTAQPLPPSKACCRGSEMKLLSQVTCFRPFLVSNLGTLRAPSRGLCVKRKKVRRGVSPPPPPSSSSSTCEQQDNCPTLTQ